MRNGTTDLVVRNVLHKGGPDRVAQWTTSLMSRLRPGGMWIVPRSVSTVLVLSTDPKVARVHCIFPDAKLVEILRASGWIVQHRDSHHPV